MPWRYLAAPIAIMVGTLGLIWIAEPHQSSGPLAILAAILLGGLGVGLFVTYQVRLEVSNTTIVFRSWGYSVVSNWDNLLGHARRPMGIYSAEALILRSPGAQFHPILEIGLRLVGRTSLRGGPHGLGLSEPDWGGIPVGLFANPWQDSELGHIIQQFAPTAYATQL